jgi:hypothetical protein
MRGLALEITADNPRRGFPRFPPRDPAELTDADLVDEDADRAESTARLGNDH